MEDERGEERTKNAAIAAVISAIIQELGDDDNDLLVTSECYRSKALKNALIALPLVVRTVSKEKQLSESNGESRTKESQPTAAPSSILDEAVLSSQLSEADFKAQFGMSRSTIQFLIRCMQQHLTKCVGYSIERKILMSVWLLSNAESYRDVSCRFGVSKGTLHLIFFEFCKILTDGISKTFITWPEEEDYQRIAAKFQANHRIPGVIGVIDVCHIIIKVPSSVDHGNYLNQKQRYSVVLQAICDENMLFTDVFCGSPGSVHEAEVFRNSPINGKLGNLPKHYHVLADSQYPLQESVLTPYFDDGRLSQVQKRFNFEHSCATSVIERAFAQLKYRFRRLKYLDMTRMDLISTVVTAACVLHNIILSLETPDEFPFVEECCGREPGLPIDYRYVTTAAVRKRNTIADML